MKDYRRHGKNYLLSTSRMSKAHREISSEVTNIGSPYMIKMPIRVAHIHQISNGKNLDAPATIHNRVRVVSSLNYCKDGCDINVFKACADAFDASQSFGGVAESDNENQLGVSVIRISDSQRKPIKNLRVAIANTDMNEDDIAHALLGTPNLSQSRYSERITNILNIAANEKVDMLVLPELYVPFAWLSCLKDFSAKNQMAIVAGAEYVGSQTKKAKGRVYNLTAAILPYTIEGYKYAELIFHHKVHYAPQEIEEIGINHLECAQGRRYELFCWNDIWFSPYCCFELASARERCMFQAYADIIVAVEWNKDLEYFSNIIASLSRDMSCYCIQVNNSKYGDSRIVQPSESKFRDVVRIKGGINKTVIVGELDIPRIRDTQYLENGGAFGKPPAPDMRHDIVKKKMNGTLLQHMIALFRETGRRASRSRD